MEQPKRKNDSCLFTVIMMGIIIFIISISSNKTESQYLGESNKSTIWLR